MVRAVIIIYVARIIGAEEYGIFTLRSESGGIFMFFSDLGLTSILIRELSKGGEGKKSFFIDYDSRKKYFSNIHDSPGWSFRTSISKFAESGHLIIFIAIFVA